MELEFKMVFNPSLGSSRKAILAELEFKITLNCMLTLKLAYDTVILPFKKKKRREVNQWNGTCHSSLVT